MYMYETKLALPEVGPAMDCLVVRFFKNTPITLFEGMTEEKITETQAAIDAGETTVEEVMAYSVMGNGDVVVMLARDDPAETEGTTAQVYVDGNLVKNWNPQG